VRGFKLESAIYIVATPIGNMRDITRRAIDVLSEVDFIAAEDTRMSRRLLEQLDIDTPMVSLHEHNERQKSQILIDKVSAGGSMALISDAGTPLISDPGYFLVKQAKASGVRCIPVPGACALVAALSVSGLSSARFSFEGFLPHKTGAKKAELERLISETRTMIFYESPHRILETLRLCAELFADRQMALAREITKRFETYLTGPVNEVLSIVESDSMQQKGEFVLMIEGGAQLKPSSLSDSQRTLLKGLLQELPPKKAAALIADYTGINKREVYNEAVALRQ
jgi:16S rRNA (cytidine1402-2'-O)-methyltransferase